jgi:Fuc2NAc and GlcNAc transferase
MTSLGVGPYILFAVVFALSACGVALFRVWSNRRGLLDVPNERSSHSRPTPRGGGLIIVFISLAAYAMFSIVFDLPASWGYFIGAALVAGVSWLDDLYTLPFWMRLIVHIAAAVVLVLQVGAWSEFTLPVVDQRFEIGSLAGHVVAVLWLVWFLNAYNFMDGIDGIAAFQAVVAGGAWTLLASDLALPTTAMLSGVIAASTAGFLVHNWQPAGVFMGDIGSAFLGFSLAAMPLLGRSEAGLDVPLLPFAGVVFVWFFLFDTVFTLMRRLVGRKKVWEAHREHVYQRLIIWGWEHRHVAALYGGASAILSALTLLSAWFSGIFTGLAFSFLVCVSSLMIYAARREKR